MKLDLFILQRLQELFPDDFISENNVKEHIITNKISLIFLVSGVGNLQINIRHLWAEKMALAMNAIIMNEFDSIPEFYAAMNIDEVWWTRLMDGKAKPSEDLVRQLIKEHKIKPSYIFLDNPEMV